MRPVSRSRVNKRSSARSFRNKIGHPHPKNLASRPMRGGWRI